jgi:hypothetical protein
VPSSYEIVVTGAGGPTLFAALPGFEERPAPEGCVRVVGSVADQAALQGVLHRLHELHVELLEVHRLVG